MMTMVMKAATIAAIVMGKFMRMVMIILMVVGIM